MLLDDSVAKELYQQLSTKVQKVAQKVTAQVQTTTQAWDQSIPADEDGLSSTPKDKL